MNATPAPKSAVDRVSTNVHGTDQLRRRVLWVLLSCVALGAACYAPPSARGPERGSKIGFVFVGQRDDLGYNEAAWAGSEAVAKAFPDHEVLRTENVPESRQALASMEALVQQGAGIIFATSFGYLEHAYELARRHPDVIVVHQGGVEPNPPLPNFGTYWGAVYEPVYLAGIAAGAASRTGRLGYVVAFPIPATYANVNAFTLGAQTVRPDVQTSVVFTGDWCDPDRQATAAQRLLSLGADVLAQHQDCTSTVLRAAEAAGVATVGYHADGSEAAPRSWLVGSVWDWKPLYIAMVRAARLGKFAASDYEGDFRGRLRDGDNPFILTEFGPAVSEQTRAAVAAAEARLRAGESPFAGPLSDREGRVRVPAGQSLSPAEVDRMDYFVPGVLSAAG